MSLSFFAFVMAVCSGTAFILALHLLCRREELVRRFGAGTFLVLYVLCMLRFVMMWELPFTARVQVQGGLSGAYMKMAGTRGLNYPQGMIGASEIRFSMRYTPAEMLLQVWVIVAAALILRLVWQNIRLGRKLARYEPNTCPAADEALALMKRRVWWEPKVKVCVCPDIDVPMGAGVFRKYICLPSEPYTRDELFYIIRHEYTHFCSRDIAWKLVARVFCCVFWWDPAVWLMKRDMDRLLELRCDQRATRGFGKGQRLAYLGIIVRLLGDGDRRGPAIPAGGTGLFYRDSRRDVKERFAALTRSKAAPGKGKLWALAGLTAVVIAVSYAFILRPTNNVPSESLYESKFLGQDYEVIRVERSRLGDWVAYADTGYSFTIDEDEALACEDQGVPTYRWGSAYDWTNYHYIRLPFDWGWIEWS